MISPTSYILLGIVIEALAAIVVSYLDENDMWGTALFMGLGGFLLPFFFALPLLIPNFMFTWREILLLAPYSIAKSILLIAWIWTLYASSGSEIQTIRLKIRAANSIVGVCFGIAAMPFIIRDLSTFVILSALLLILVISAHGNFKEYRKRKALLQMIVSALKEEGLARIDELVVKLKLPDYLVQDLVYELCNRDMVDIIESRGIYVYLRPNKIKL